MAMNVAPTHLLLLLLLLLAVAAAAAAVIIWKLTMLLLLPLLLLLELVVVWVSTWLFPPKSSMKSLLPGNMPEVGRATSRLP
jgi:hypothetical protein